MLQLKIFNFIKFDFFLVCFYFISNYNYNFVISYNMTNIISSDIIFHLKSDNAKQVGK